MKFSDARKPAPVTVPVRYEVRTRAANAWLIVCLLLLPIVGRARAGRWAEAGVWKLSRYRINGGKWQRFTLP